MMKCLFTCFIFLSHLVMGQEGGNMALPGLSPKFDPRGAWFNPGEGCDILNYMLFEYTDEHPDKVKYIDESERVEVEGFTEYLAERCPIKISDYETQISFIRVVDGQVLIPTGQPVVFLIDRNGDGYLQAFGQKRSVNHFADPWKLDGFSYKKAVGITLEKKPDFIKDDGGSRIVSLNDNDYHRLREITLQAYNPKRPQQRKPTEIDKWFKGAAKIGQAIQLAEMERLYNTPVSIWGKVVDTDGNPISAASVELSYFDKFVWDDPKVRPTEVYVKTDKNGRFEALDKKGAMVSVRVKKKGYAATYDVNGRKASSKNLHCANLSAEEKKSWPSKEKPLVLTLRKKGEIANLQKIRAQSFSVPKDGTEAALELKDLEVTIKVKCKSDAPEPFNYDRYDWEAEIMIEKGKLLAVKDEHAVEAPEDGYQKVIKIDMPADTKGNWSRSTYGSDANFWLKLDSGRYGLISIKVITGRNHAVMVDGVVNLDGTNSFEE